MRVDKDKLYLLHTRPYRDNSLLVDFLSLNHGRITLVVALRGKEKKRTYLQPCQMLEASYLLKPNLGRLLELEFCQIGTYRPPMSMFIYYQYIHELLLKLLPVQEPVEEIFNTYQQSLVLLCEEAVHSALRHIEVALIELLSGFPDFNRVITANGEQLLTELADDFPLYLSVELGISTTKANNAIKLEKQQLLALLDFFTDSTNELAARNAQRITTFYINQLLGKQVLASREMYKKLMKLIES